MKFAASAAVVLVPMALALPSGAGAADRSFFDARGHEGAAEASTAPELVTRERGFLTTRSADPATEVVLDYLRSHPKTFGLDAGDLGALELTSRYTSSDGVTHLRWIQTSGGVPSLDSGVIAHVTRSGELVSVSGNPVADLAADDTAPELSASAALGASRRDVGGSLIAPRADAAGGPERATTFAGGDAAGLVVFATEDGGRLAWQVTVTGEEGRLYSEVRDADTGALLQRRNLTADASLKAFQRAPGAPGGGTHEVFGIGGGANPIGDSTWLNNTGAGTRLQGNNAHAYPDTDGDNVETDTGLDTDIPATAPATLDWQYNQVSVAGGTPCPTSPGPAPCTWNSADLGTIGDNLEQATTNLFFHTNRWHDHLLDPNIGFTEAAGNFQAANAAGQGLGGDAVRAESDDKSNHPTPAMRQYDNANFGTPKDGLPPRMQMFLRTARDVNGSDDASVIYHEYTHGFSNRTVVDAGGNSTLDDRPARGMGEGWSDFFALDFLVATGLYPDTAADGEVFLNQYSWGATGTRDQGIDCPVGSAAATCNASGQGGYTYGDMASRYNSARVHGIGEIFSQTLWDLRAIVGSPTARKLVSGGMRLSVPNPNLLDMRDAILREAQVLGGNLYDTVWTVFAKRGMGFGAVAATSPVSNPDPDIGDAPSTAFPSPTATSNFATPPTVESVGRVYSDPFPTGDNDGIPEPGERFSLIQAVKNVYPNGTLTGLTASIGSNPLLTVLGPAAWAAPIGHGQAAASSSHFVLALVPTAPCGATANASATFHSQPGSDTTLALPIVVGSAGGPPACDVTIPQAVTGAATPAFTTAAATGTINPARKATSFRYVYGTTPAYGAATRPVVAGAGNAAVPARATLTGLKPNTVYHYRLQSLRDGVPAISGQNATFRTPKLPVFPRTATYTLSARGILSFGFSASPSTRGTATFESVLSFAAAKKKATKRKLRLGVRSFRVSKTGKVKVSLKLSKATLAKVKKLRRLRVRAIVRLSGRSFIKTFTLRPPKAVKRKR